MAKERNAHGAGGRPLRMKGGTGRWRASYQDLQGKRRYVYGDTEGEAQGKLTDALADIRRGISLEPSRETVAQFLSRWLRDVVQPSVRTRTHLSYSADVRNYIVPALGKTRLAQLTPSQVQALYTRLLARGLAPKTIRNVHTTLRRALGQALKWNLVARNVADATTPPRVPRYVGQALTDEEIRTLLDASGDRLRPILLTAVMTGLRQGELLALRWADVNLAQGEISVNGTLQQRGRGWAIEEPKTVKSRRLVAIDRETVRALYRQLDQQQHDREIAGSRWQEHGLVFTSTVGTPMHGGKLLRDFKRVLALAGVRKVRFHDLRHTHASILLRMGVHPKVVQERMGYSAITVTMDIYSHLIPSLQRDAAAGLQRLIFASVPTSVPDPDDHDGDGLRERGE